MSLHVLHNSITKRTMRAYLIVLVAASSLVAASEAASVSGEPTILSSITRASNNKRFLRSYGMEDLDTKDSGSEEERGAGEKIAKIVSPKGIVDETKVEKLVSPKVIEQAKRVGLVDDALLSPAKRAKLVDDALLSPAKRAKRVGDALLSPAKRTKLVDPNAVDQEKLAKLLDAKGIDQAAVAKLLFADVKTIDEAKLAKLVNAGIIDQWRIDRLAKVTDMKSIDEAQFAKLLGTGAIDQAKLMKLAESGIIDQQKLAKLVNSETIVQEKVTELLDPKVIETAFETSDDQLALFNQWFVYEDAVVKRLSAGDTKTKLQNLPTLVKFNDFRTSMHKNQQLTKLIDTKSLDDISFALSKSNTKPMRAQFEKWFNAGITKEEFSAAIATVKNPIKQKHYGALDNHYKLFTVMKKGQGITQPKSIDGPAKPVEAAKPIYDVDDVPDVAGAVAGAGAAAT
uniref:PaRXLR66 n=1 Tax=Phytophthora agathidicida TaxID=1642459 RepID=A0A7G4WI55_9STRA|nr:PaRXLR66 [Phytophthora agathidicida]